MSVAAIFVLNLSPTHVELDILHDRSTAFYIHIGILIEKFTPFYSYLRKVFFLLKIHRWK